MPITIANTLKNEPHITIDINKGKTLMIEAGKREGRERGENFNFNEDIEVELLCVTEQCL